MSEGGGAGAESPPPGSPKGAAPARVALSESEMGALSAVEWCGRWRQQEAYVATLERRLAHQEGELEELRQSADRTRGLLGEAQQREKALMRRLTAKEQETQDYVCQLNELKSGQSPSSLRSTLLDPAVNCVLAQLRTELQSTRSKLEDTQNELTAWKFTPDSNTGKRLMAKCRLLYQENEELGKATSSGRVAKLESDLALQRSFAEEVRQSQNELDAFLADLDEDVEGMQSTILFLQTELRKSKEAQAQAQQLVNGRSNGDSHSGGACEQERTDSDSELERTCVKRARRSSVLSIDYNEEDALGIIGTNGDAAMPSDPE